jgi:ergothioneine biosynthesis protein EgtB
MQPREATSHDDLAARFGRVRSLSEALAAPLSDSDATVQSMDDASPAKWHLAHTTWFFETFVLRDHVPGYRLHDPRFPFLFNSYYEAEGRRHARGRRGMITRPTLAEVTAYRAAVDAAIAAALPSLGATPRDLVELGCHHEQQHQELLLTDILHLFSENPLEPALWSPAPKVPVAVPDAIRWLDRDEGVVEIGHDGRGFAFD